jgi:hypothetical protein
VLNTVVGGLGVDALDVAGFDIQALAAGGNAAFATLTTDGVGSALYSIDLATGAATPVGTGRIGAVPTLVRGFTIVPDLVAPPANLYALAARIPSFASMPRTRRTIISSTPSRGTSRAVRRSWGSISARRRANSSASGATTALHDQSGHRGGHPAGRVTAAPGDDNPFTGLVGTAFGVDFNPVPDLAGNPSLRVISEVGQNLRINVNPGANVGQVTTDANINPAATTSITGSAYTNVDVNPATATTLFGIDVSPIPMLDSCRRPMPTRGRTPSSGRRSASRATRRIDRLRHPDPARRDHQAFAALTINGRRRRCIRST